MTPYPTPLPVPENPPPRPLSYEDLRRFLFLLIALALAAVTVHALADLLILFTLVIFGALVLNPVVVWLEKRRVRRGLSVILVLLGLLGGGVGIGFMVVPPLVEQVGTLAAGAPDISQKLNGQAKAILQRFPQIEKALPPAYRGKNLDKFSANVGKNTVPQLVALAKNLGPRLGNRVLSFTFAFVGGLATLLISLLLLAFMLANPQPLVAGLLGVVPARHRDATGRSFGRIQTQVVAWMRATLINGCLSGLQTAIYLHFVGVPSAIVFGVLAFLGEFVPTIGPISMAIPALLVAASLGGATFFKALGAILFVQLVSSNLLVPLVMGRELQLHPVTITFFALSMGGLFGIAGAVLAVPLAAIAKILVDEFLLKPNAVPTEELDKRANRLISDRSWDLEEAEGEESKTEEPFTAEKSA